MLEIRNMDVHYGMIHALKDVSFEVHRGEIVVLLGANGAGKTTTLRTISGLQRPTNGQVILNGVDITNVSAQERVKMGISHVPEGRRVFPGMTVLENLELPNSSGQEKANSRNPIRWRAADAGYRPGPYESA